MTVTDGCTCNVSSSGQRVARAALVCAFACLLVGVLPAVAHGEVVPGAQDVSLQDEQRLSDGSSGSEQVPDQGILPDVVMGDSVPADESTDPSDENTTQTGEGEPTAAGVGDVPTDGNDGSHENASDASSDAGEVAVEDGQTEALPADDASHGAAPAQGAVDDGAAADVTQVPTTQPDAAPKNAQVDGVTKKTDQSQVKAAKPATSATAPKLTAQAATGPKLPAGALNVKNGTYFFESNAGDDKVLAVGAKPPKVGSVVKTWNFTGSNAQKWEVVKDTATGWYKIMLAGTNRTLALGVDSKKKTVQLVSATTAGDASLWAFVKTYSWCNLVNRSLTDCLLSVTKATAAKPGGILEMAKQSTSPTYARFFMLDPAPKVSTGAAGVTGTYSVIPTMNTSLVTEVKSESTANGANVWLWNDKSRAHQHISFQPDGKGFYTAWIVGTGKVMSMSSASVCPGNNVVQKAYVANDDTQKWALRTYPDGTVSIVNKKTGLALGVCGTACGSNLAGTRNDGYRTTSFRLVRRQLLSAGVVEIHPRTAAGVSVDIKYGVSSGKGEVILWANKNGINQKFELVSAGTTDMWRIRTGSSGGWITQSGSTIIQTGNGSTGRNGWNTWMAVYSGGWYSFVNAASGKALDMRYGKTANGTELIAWSVNGNDSQHFTIVASDLMKAGCYMLQNGGGRFMQAVKTSANTDLNVRVNAKNAAAGQVFDIRKSGVDWTIRGYQSGRYLTASNASAGANVLLESRNASSKGQLWTFTVADGGRVVIKSIANPKLSLDAIGNGSSNGANVDVAISRQTNGQMWRLCEVFNDGALNATQKRVISAAKTTPSPGAGWCAAWITNIFQNAGVGSWYGNACDHYRLYCGSADLSAIKPGMIIAVSTHNKSSAGRQYGHVGIYVGGGMVMDNVGNIRTISILEWIDYYSDRVSAKWGWFGTKIA